MTVDDDVAAAVGVAVAAIADLRRSVTAMQERLGETVDVRRLRDDVARLTADLALIAGEEPGPVRRRTGTGSTGSTVYIPEGDYDPSFWADAEDEGVGPRRRA